MPTLLLYCLFWKHVNSAKLCLTLPNYAFSAHPVIDPEYVTFSISKFTFLSVYVIILIFRIPATEIHVFPNWLILYLLQIILPMLGMTSIAMKIMVSHGKKLTREFISPSLLCVFSLPGRALPGITSGPEVRQIFKILTLRKPDVFLPGRRIFNGHC